MNKGIFVLAIFMFFGCGKEELTSGVSIINNERGCLKFLIEEDLIGDSLIILSLQDSVIETAKLKDSLLTLNTLLTYSDMYKYMVIGKKESKGIFDISTPLHQIFGQYQLKGERVVYENDFELFRDSVSYDLNFFEGDTTEATLESSFGSFGLNSGIGTTCDSIIVDYYSIRKALMNYSTRQMNMKIDRTSYGVELEYRSKSLQEATETLSVTRLHGKLE